MKVLVIGGGGREDAICRTLAKSPKVSRLYCAPGNGGTAGVAENVDIAVMDFDGLVAFARAEGIELTVCQMDEPLVNGIADTFSAAGLAIFGPSAAAAHIEGSKAYSKEFMRRHNIPTAGYATFDNFHAAMGHATRADFPIVVKADGLAAGKGVSICQNIDTAEKALREIFFDKKFGASGDMVVIEEFLHGHECSVLAFCDGTNIVPMPGAKDHKAAFENNMGPNTGGMGVVTPCPHYSDDIAAACMDLVFKPTIAGLAAEGREFIGIMFFGLMLTAKGPKVLEYNCRMGDPETQALLPLLQTDLADIILACMSKKLDNIEIKWKNNAVCCVVATSGGYPDAYTTGHPITGHDQATPGVTVFHSGTKVAADGIVTSGGRVLCIVAEGENADAARALAYKAVGRVEFPGIRYRKDIGAAL